MAEKKNEIQEVVLKYDINSGDPKEDDFPDLDQAREVYEELRLKCKKGTDFIDVKILDDGGMDKAFNGDPNADEWTPILDLSNQFNPPSGEKLVRLLKNEYPHGGLAMIQFYRSTVGRKKKELFPPVFIPFPPSSDDEINNSLLVVREKQRIAREQQEYEDEREKRKKEEEFRLKMEEREFSDHQERARRAEAEAKEMRDRAFKVGEEKSKTEQSYLLEALKLEREERKAQEERRIKELELESQREKERWEFERQQREKEERRRQEERNKETNTFIEFLKLSKEEEKQRREEERLRRMEEKQEQGSLGELMYQMQQFQMQQQKQNQQMFTELITAMQNQNNGRRDYEPPYPGRYSGYPGYHGYEEEDEKKQSDKDMMLLMMRQQMDREAANSANQLNMITTLLGTLIPAIAGGKGDQDSERYLKMMQNVYQQNMEVLREQATQQKQQNLPPQKDVEQTQQYISLMKENYDRTFNLMQGLWDKQLTQQQAQQQSQQQWAQQQWAAQQQQAQQQVSAGGGLPGNSPATPLLPGSASPMVAPPQMDSLSGLKQLAETMRTLRSINDELFPAPAGGDEGRDWGEVIQNVVEKAGPQVLNRFLGSGEGQQQPTNNNAAQAGNEAPSGGGGLRPARMSPPGSSSPASSSVGANRAPVSSQSAPQQTAQPVANPSGVRMSDQQQTGVFGWPLQEVGGLEESLANAMMQGYTPQQWFGEVQQKDAGKTEMVKMMISSQIPQNQFVAQVQQTANNSALRSIRARDWLEQLRDVLYS